MAIKFQYNKTSRQLLEKQLKIRERALPTLQSKETALRMEVKRARSEIEELEQELEKEIQSYDKMMGMWLEFDASLLRVKDVNFSKKKIAGVVIPMLDSVDFETQPFSVFNRPKWYLDGVKTLERLAEIGIRREFHELRVMRLDYARKKNNTKSKSIRESTNTRLSRCYIENKALLGRRGKFIEIIAKNYACIAR